jgi:Domain of Unknown Function (DUF1080)
MPPGKLHMMNRASRLCAIVLFATSPFLCGIAVSADAEWTALLDGSAPATLNNWSRIGVDNWRIEDGAVVADKQTVKDINFLISKVSYADFQLRAEFWVDGDTRSGILIRGLDPYRVHARNSYDINICDKCGDAGYGTGSIVNFAKVSPSVTAAGRWNTLEILAQGAHIVVTLNGAKTVDFIDSTFPGGPLALAYGGGVVKWRKVLIRAL